MPLLRADPAGVDDMYIRVSKEGQQPRHITGRGSSKLEGLHSHMKHVHKGPNTSPQVAQAQLELWMGRVNIRAGINNRGWKDHGTCRLW